MDNSVLRISNNERALVGTGFVIDSDDNGVFVATCGHVVNDCGKNILVEGNGAQLIINAYDDGLDLAVLYVTGLNKYPLPVMVNKLADRVNVIGYSTLMGDPKKEAINKISVKTKIEVTKKPNFSVASIRLYPKEAISSGYSGSPVICNSTNNVIGIVNIQVGEDTNYAICAKHLLDIYSVKNPKVEDIRTKSKAKKELTTEISHEEYICIKKEFENSLSSSLKSFSTQKKVWIEPRLHKDNEDSGIKICNSIKISVDDIIDNPTSLVVNGRQQFGLTCLSHYLVKKAWLRDEPSLWLYIDANDLKATSGGIKKHLAKKTKKLGLSVDDVECVILDEFSGNVKDASKILHELCSVCEGLPIVVMKTTTENPMLNESTEISNCRKFDALYLWALPRIDVRQVVSEYNNEQYVGDENTVVSKIVSDLEFLNIPRTALNCLTILKIYEIEFDDSPVNRTEMMHRVLYLLFNIDDIPQYKNRPDLKDTEHILGYFCGNLILSNNYYFSREWFLDELNAFCESNEIDIETQVIFDVLYTNNIIVNRGLGFCFKFSYWVFYFAAHHMCHKKEFADFILSEMAYVSYPELIEFYTGIDRRREDALTILTKDIRVTREVVDKKCGLPKEFNIYDMAKWTPTEDQIEYMHEEVANGALNSNLPEAIKDQYADKTYNRARPLSQSIHTILESYSLLRLMRTTDAGCKALRNSDYSSPAIRHLLLKEILLGWEMLIKVLIVLSPVMADKGYAQLEGASFKLIDDDFHGTQEEKFFQIIQMLPSNVVRWYRDDLFSKKMAPLLYKFIKNEESDLLKHVLNLLIVNKRPKGWDSHIAGFIFAEDKNSFYLSDIYQTLRAEYEYNFMSDNALSTLGDLIKKTAAKHQKGFNKKGIKVIKNKSFDHCVPFRDIAPE